MSPRQHQALAVSARRPVTHEVHIGVVLSGASRITSIDDTLFSSIEASGFTPATKEMLRQQLQTIAEQLRIVQNSLQLQQDTLQHFERLYTVQEQSSASSEGLWQEWLGSVGPMLSPEFSLYTREETPPQELYGLKQRAIPSYLLSTELPTHEQVRQGLEFWYSEHEKLRKKLVAFQASDAELRIKLENILAAKAPRTLNKLIRS